jgi:hypothetical protein
LEFSDLMPVDLPPNRKLKAPEISSASVLSSRILNWAGLIIGVGLCLWAINYGLSVPDYVNSPSLYNTPGDSSEWWTAGGLRHGAPVNIPTHAEAPALARFLDMEFARPCAIIDADVQESTNLLQEFTNISDIVTTRGAP